MDHKQQSSSTSDARKDEPHMYAGAEPLHVNSQASNHPVLTPEMRSNIPYRKKHHSEGDQDKNGAPELPIETDGLLASHKVQHSRRSSDSTSDRDPEDDEQESDTGRSHNKPPPKALKAFCLGMLIVCGIALIVVAVYFLYIERVMVDQEDEVEALKASLDRAFQRSIIDADGWDIWQESSGVSPKNTMQAHRLLGDDELIPVSEDFVFPSEYFSGDGEDPEHKGIGAPSDTSPWIGKTRQYYTVILLQKRHDVIWMHSEATSIWTYMKGAGITVNIREMNHSQMILNRYVKLDDPINSLGLPSSDSVSSTGENTTVYIHPWVQPSSTISRNYALFSIYSHLDILDSFVVNDTISI